MMKTITIKEETWKKLMMRKMYSSQTFDAIINGLMDGMFQNLNKSEVKDGKPNKVADVEDKE